MSIELLYTSAPQGLKQGSRGFCTVLSTVGLPINLAQRLESLSGYRHLYQPGEQRDSDNPVCYSHLKLNVGGKTVSILSRITAYGVDYSQRTNKIAHHVVLDGSMPACGPAAVLAQPGIMRSQWDGQCRTLPVGPSIPAISTSPAPCRLWQQVTGDAGWAGVIANDWMQPAIKPTWIIFSESQSQSMLALMQEVIAILPESKRWQATFSTYCTNLPPDVDCRVRCVVAGSDEARMAIARGTVIDLTKGLGEPPANSATAAARQGIVIGINTPTPSRANEFIIQSDETEDAELQSLIDAVEGNSILDDDPEYELKSADLATTPPSLLRVQRQRAQRSRLNTASFPISIQPKSKKFLYGAVATISILVFVALGIGVYSFVQSISQVAAVMNEFQDNPTDSTSLPNELQKNDPLMSQPENPAKAVSATTPVPPPTPPAPVNYELKLDLEKPFDDAKVVTINEHALQNSKSIVIGKFVFLKDGVETAFDKGKLIFKNESNPPQEPPSWLEVREDGTIFCTADAVANLSTPISDLKFKVEYTEGDPKPSDSFSIQLINDPSPDISFEIQKDGNDKLKFPVAGTKLIPKYTVDRDADEAKDSIRKWTWYSLTAGKPETFVKLQDSVGPDPEYVVQLTDYDKAIYLKLNYKSTDKPIENNVTEVKSPFIEVLPVATISIKTADKFKDFLIDSNVAVDDLPVTVDFDLSVLAGLEKDYNYLLDKTKASPIVNKSGQGISFTGLTIKNIYQSIKLLDNKDLSTAEEQKLEAIKKSITDYRSQVKSANDTFLVSRGDFRSQLFYNLKKEDILSGWIVKNILHDCITQTPVTSKILVDLVKAEADLFSRFYQCEKTITDCEEFFRLESKKDPKTGEDKARLNLFKEKLVDLVEVRKFKRIWQPLSDDGKILDSNVRNSWKKLSISVENLRNTLQRNILKDNLPVYVGSLSVVKAPITAGMHPQIIILPFQLIATFRNNDTGTIREALQTSNKD